MTLLDTHWPPSAAMRRWFGGSLATLLLLAAYWMWDRVPMLAMSLSVAAVLVAVSYYRWPATQLFWIRAWQRVTYPLAWVASHLLLGGVFFGILLPIGIIARLLGHDPLQLKRRDRTSHWVAARERRDPSAYFKQF